MMIWAGSEVRYSWRETPVPGDLALWRVRVFTGRDGPLIADHPIHPVNPKLPTAVIVQDLGSTADCLGLRVGDSAGTLASRLGDFPASVLAANDIARICLTWHGI